MIHPNIMTLTKILTQEIWFRLIMDITITWSYILFTILIINTEVEHDRIIISVTFLHWLYLAMKKKK